MKRKLFTDEIEETDFQRMYFDQSQAFNHNELVIVPRSKGGFSYGYVDEMKTENVCQFDHSFPHPSVCWSVRLYKAPHKAMTKILPTYRIGKLRDENDEIETQYELVEGDDYQSVLFDRDIVMQSSSIVYPFSGGGMMHCLFVKLTTMKCKCLKHDIEAVVIDTMYEELVVPLAMCGVLTIEENNKCIIIDCGDVVNEIEHYIEKTILKKINEEKEREEREKQIRQIKEVQQNDIQEAIRMIRSVGKEQKNNNNLNRVNNQTSQINQNELNQLKVITDDIKENEEEKQMIGEDQKRMIMINNLKYIIQYYRNRNYKIYLLTSKRFDYLINIIKQQKIMKNVEIIEINQMIKQQFFVELTQKHKAVLLSNREINKLEKTDDRKWLKEHQVKYELVNNMFVPDKDFKYPIEEE